MVVVLVVAVGAVLAGKNRDSGEKTAVAAESSLDVPVDNPAREQVPEEVDVQAEEPEEAAAETAKTEDAKPEAKPDVVAKADVSPPTKPAPKASEKPKVEAAAKPVVDKKEEPKAVAKAEQPKPAPKKLPKMIELGAEKCVPCKMMKPIIEELQKDYKGKLEVVFIDVWKDSSAAEKYNIQSIPTQIFLDEDGKEFSRHTGFFAKEDILKTFEDHGIKLD